jgi:hypothetical protein
LHDTPSVHVSSQQHCANSAGLEYALKASKVQAGLPRHRGRITALLIERRDSVVMYKIRRTAPEGRLSPTMRR